MTRQSELSKYIKVVYLASLKRKKEFFISAYCDRYGFHKEGVESAYNEGTLGISGMAELIVARYFNGAKCENICNEGFDVYFPDGSILEVKYSSLAVNIVRNDSFSDGGEDIYKNMSVTFYNMNSKNCDVAFLYILNNKVYLARMKPEEWKPLVTGSSSKKPGSGKIALNIPLGFVYEGYFPLHKSKNEYKFFSLWGKSKEIDLH